MDNFFEILIYAIIIISFLSSLFKKKKPVKPQGDKAQQEQGYVSLDKEVDVQAEKSESYDYDLMKEFERFFKIEEDKPSEQKKESVQATDTITPASERSTPIEIEQRKKDREITQRKPTQPVSRYSNIWEKRKADVEKKAARVDSAIEKQAAKFEKHLEVKGTVESKISRNIKERIKDPAALKNYIVISEILGKPKALRN
jgi:hypothetical protein